IYFLCAGGGTCFSAPLFLPVERPAQNRLGRRTSSCTGTGQRLLGKIPPLLAHDLRCDGSRFHDPQGVQGWLFTDPLCRRGVARHWNLVLETALLHSGTETDGKGFYGGGCGDPPLLAASFSGGEQLGDPRARDPVAPD